MIFVEKPDSSIYNRKQTEKYEVNKMTTSMYEFVKHGYLINLSLVFALFAILSRLILGIIYDALLKETDNVGISKMKFIKNFKTKVESGIQVDHLVNNPVVYVEKYIRKQRVGGISLRGLRQLSVCFLLISVILNMFTSAVAIIKEMETELIGWSILINIIALCLFCFAESIIDSSYKYEGIKINMQNYLENDYINHRNAQKEAEEELEMKENQQNVKVMEERMGKLEEKLLTADNVSLSSQEAKIIQDVLKEFLT